MMNVRPVYCEVSAVQLVGNTSHLQELLFEDVSVSVVFLFLIR